MSCCRHTSHHQSRKKKSLSLTKRKRINRGFLPFLEGDLMDLNTTLGTIEGGFSPLSCLLTGEEASVSLVDSESTINLVFLETEDGLPYSSFLEGDLEERLFFKFVDIVCSFL